MLCFELAQVVRQQFNNPHRKQMIIELLGSQFKRSYLTDEVDNPAILVNILKKTLIYSFYIENWIKSIYRILH